MHNNTSPHADPSSFAANSVERVTIMSGPLSGLAFLRHTISIIPPEGTLGFVEGEGWRCAGRFINGEWKRPSGASLSRSATHWTIVDPESKA